MKHWLPPVAVLAISGASTQLREASLDSAGLVAAEAEYRRQLGSEPSDSLASYNLGTVLVLRERYDEARPHLDRAAPQPGLTRNANYNLGATDLEPAFADADLVDREDRLRRAIESYKRALTADPSDEDAKWNLELARRLLERDPRDDSGGGGGGSGGQGQPMPGTGAPSPTPAAGGGGQPRVEETQAENLLRSAREQELDVQRDRLRKPQPPGPIRP